MAIPFLAALPATARAAYPIILSGVSRGLSSRAIERTVRAAGLQISRTRSILPLRREILARRASGRNVRYIPKNNRIDVNKLPHAITRTSKNYAHYVTYMGRGPDGVLKEMAVTIATDRDDLTPGMLEQMAEYLIDRSSNYPLEDPSTIMLSHSVRSEFLNT